MTFSDARLVSSLCGSLLCALGCGGGQGPAAELAGGTTGAGAGGLSAGAPATAGTSATAGAGSSSGGAGGGGSGGAGGVAGSNSGGAGSSSAGSSGTGNSPSSKFCGNITSAGQVRDDFSRYWDQMTPENEGKWGTVERQRDEMRWDALDRAYQYAKTNAIPFKQHTLVWGSQQPNWLGGLSPAEQRAEVEEWIRAFCERYPDTQMIDVVNEPPPHTEPVYMDALGGEGESGYDWIVQSFKWARQYCPTSVLILNDYNTIEYEADNSHFIDIVKRIQAAGAPVDALGAQAHDAYKLPTATVKTYIDKMASSTGLPVYISEYDIDLADDDMQKTVMAEQFAMFWSHPDVKGVTVWGYVVGQTWRPNTGLMTREGQPRPALSWLLEFLDR